MGGTKLKQDFIDSGQNTDIGLPVNQVRTACRGETHGGTEDVMQAKRD